MPQRSFFRAMPRAMNCSMATRCATARRARRGISATRTRGKQRSTTSTRNTRTCSDRIRCTVIAVNATSSQGSASAATAAMRTGKRRGVGGCLRQHADDLARGSRLGGTDGFGDAFAILCRDAHHQLPEAPPPPDEPPASGKAAAAGISAARKAAAARISAAAARAARAGKGIHHHVQDEPAEAGPDDEQREEGDQRHDEHQLAGSAVG